MPTDNLFPAYNSECQVELIESLIKHMRLFKKGLDDAVVALQGQHDCDYIDACQNFFYGDGAYSSAVTGMLAPLFEGILVHELVALRKAFGDRPPVNDHRRWKLLPTEPDVFWNPYVMVNKKCELGKDNIQNGSMQLLRALGIENRFPESLEAVTYFLFAYRNCALHNGMEWTEERKKSFYEQAKTHKWEEKKWFSTLTETSFNSVNLVMVYLTDQFIDETMELARQVVDVFGEVRADWLPPEPPIRLKWPGQLSQLIENDTSSEASSVCFPPLSKIRKPRSS